MKSFTFRAAWGLGLALFWSSPLTAADKQDDLMQLPVSVFNSAPISPKAIDQAEGEASRILEDAGVAVIWLNCALDSQHEVSRGRCTEASFPLHLHLRIARVSRGLKPSTVGISFSAEDGQGCYVDLFYEPIRQLEEETHVALRVILAVSRQIGHYFGVACDPPRIVVVWQKTLILPEANNSQQPRAADSDILAAWEVAVARSSPGNAPRPAR